LKRGYDYNLDRKAIKMRILVVNDDGIETKGIEILAREAAKFGEVWVVAPDEQCSAMSQCITLRREISVKESPFPVRRFQPENFLAEKPAEKESLLGGKFLPAGEFRLGKGRAFRIGGTPADCVRVAVSYLMPERPDYIFSGINFGFNAGYDIAYSGTVGAAMEGLMNGIPAAAFSVDSNGVYGAVEKYLPGIIEEILGSEPLKGEIWNVNFPGCGGSACKGILRERRIAASPLYIDRYKERTEADGTVYLSVEGFLHDDIGTENDLEAVKNQYISIGKIPGVCLGKSE